MKRAWILWAFCLTGALVRAQTSAENEWESIRRTAYSQHEAVTQAIRQSDFQRVLSQMRLLYALKFPPDYEWLLGQEIELVSDSLMHARQYALAHQILDEGFNSLKLPKNRAAVLRKKSYLLKQQGMEQEAMRYFERAFALDPSP